MVLRLGIGGGLDAWLGMGISRKARAEEDVIAGCLPKPVLHVVLVVFGFAASRVDRLARGKPLGEGKLTEDQTRLDA